LDAAWICKLQKRKNPIQNPTKIAAATTKAGRGPNGMAEAFVFAKFQNLIQNPPKVCPAKSKFNSKSHQNCRARGAQVWRLTFYQRQAEMVNGNV